MAKLAALQMVSGTDVKANLAQVEQALSTAKFTESTLVVLPECFACFGGGDKQLLKIAEPIGDGPIHQKLAEFAKRFGVWIVGGSIPTQIDKADQFAATCPVFDDQGELIEDYQKIHLFDVEVEDNTRTYQESRYTQAGDKLVVIPNTPFGTLGVAICYDIRFAGLFQAMGQIDTLALPAAFTKITGLAHWHTLLGARSIEKQCYLVAANQGGVHENGRETFGHSCIYSPWGKLAACIEQGDGWACAELQQDELDKIRRNMPIANHNRFRSNFA